MGPLSNFLRRADAPHAGANTSAATKAHAGELVCRPVRQDEVHDALRLILGSHGRLAENGQVLDFLQFAVQRRVALADLWIATRAGAVAWALLPIISPGRTMLLLQQSHYPHRAADNDDDDDGDEPRRLVAAACAYYAARGVRLAQCLLDPTDAPAGAMLAAIDFRPMAELIYLQTPVRRPHAAPPLPGGMSWVGYAPETHDLFGQTIARTYRDSLDCPALNGLRDMEDILAGHKSSGEFEPGLWFLLCEDAPGGGVGASDVPVGVSGRPIGALLLSRLARGEAMELVYLGLVPEARGRKFGDLMVRQAFAAASASNVPRLTLAVDAANTPALRLYHRHGLQRVGQKVAVMRDLRPAPAEPGAQPAPTPLTAAGQIARS